MGFNKKGKLRKDKPKYINIKVFDGETVLFSLHEVPLLSGAKQLIRFICEKLEGWDYLANMIFEFMSGGGSE